ncbi:MAG: hypothetical protein JWP46_3643, partial [Modestobacter sp.]|nr:hypothetical protein [Modestobacter sp.]
MSDLLSSPAQQPITEMLDAATVQSIADDVWTSLVGDGEV